MAEDDEIDILGDFNMDNYLNRSDTGIYAYENSSLVGQNSNILDCNYTIHPQWLLDKPSPNPECWYDSSYESPEFSSKIPATTTASTETMTNFGDHLGHVFTEHVITDESGWTEKEKALLGDGLEIFGRSNERLAQFIGSRTPSEVRYYLKNFYTEVQASGSEITSGVCEELNNYVSDVLDDTQIPASVEEVIAMVSTASPTVPVSKKSRKNSYSSSNSNDHSEFKSKQNNSQSRKKPIKTINSSNYVNKKSLKTIPKRLEPGQKFEISTGTGLAVPTYQGEEIVEIRKVESESEDVDVDIEDVSDSESKPDRSNPSDSSGPHPNTASSDYPNSSVSSCSSKHKTQMDLSSLAEPIRKQLTTLEIPKFEVTLDENFVSDAEKFIHSEFFEGRPLKTPIRYLKIRNYIISRWNSKKPLYIKKTALRDGLKNCGDVNSIGMIHTYLEQIGAINFGCPETTYVRPLYDNFKLATQGNSNKSRHEESSTKAVTELKRKRRIKKPNPYVNPEGGYTLVHDENGSVTDITNVYKNRKTKYVKNPSVTLINVKSFPAGSGQATIRMHLAALLLMDLHAHTSSTEVMGLVGGDFDPVENSVTVSRYEPCVNVASSATHCDMCPVSQADAATRIHNAKSHVLGWFHSHPTFAPQPSQQDLNTQWELQQWIGNANPCLGVILSPFSLNGALIASPFTCLAVEPKENFADQLVPYQYDVELVCRSEKELEDEFFEEVKRVIESAAVTQNEKRVKWNEPCFRNQSVTHLEKYVMSAKMRLARSGRTFSTFLIDHVLARIADICSERS